jgi:hypothetical protein
MDLYKNYIGHNKFIKLCESVREEVQNNRALKKRNKALEAVMYPEQKEQKKQKLRLKRKVANKRKRELEAITGTTTKPNNMFTRKKKQFKNKR